MFYGTYKLMMNRYPSVSSTPSSASKPDSGSPAFAERIRRRRACRTLLTKSDHILADMGFSRELLEQGVKAWPWLVNAETTNPSVASASVVALNVPHLDRAEKPHWATDEQRYAA